ncbi:hypothetical protein GCM10010402_14130 [Actinomadura luteofluorescens]|uniref:hypothetical protein n=1 Tax=Actinomadura luteofluorescens TaxID=46163 RepID=UPI0021648E5F|nr:hypothetical protein [Actinomadura glauciflava]MCR3739698.1 hypothetical protein [Actinomadura glauciflava]
MSEFARALIAAAIQDRGPAWEAAGIQWQIITGPKTDKPSVWVTCENAHNLAQLTIWSSGEAELDLGPPTGDATTSIHYDLATHEDLAACLDDLTDLLNRRPTA